MVNLKLIKTFDINSLVELFLLEKYKTFAKILRENFFENVLIEKYKISSMKSVLKIMLLCYVLLKLL